VPKFEILCAPLRCPRFFLCGLMGRRYERPQRTQRISLRSAKKGENQVITSLTDGFCWQAAHVILGAVGSSPTWRAQQA
jgi:hypothetical protein